MKAVILVGGFGTRLRPLTLTTPKQMLPVVDRTMLEHVVGRLGSFGVTEAVLALGYKDDVFVEAYPDGVCAGVQMHYATEPEPLDTAGAIRFAATHAGIDDTFLVVNGDIITDLDVTQLWQKHRELGAEATIALTHVDDPSKYGVVSTDEDGRVLGFVEKPKRDEAPSNWINAGTYVFEPSVLDRIEPERRVSIERETFPAIVNDGGLWALPTDDYWIDAGVPATYLQVNWDLCFGAGNASYEPIDGGARIDAGAHVEESIVMAGAQIDAGAHVCRSVVLPDAKISSQAVVERSIIGPKSIVGSGASVQNLSVVGSGVTVDEGTHLDGRKLPEE